MTAAIILYTAHHCPFAHRVQVVLRELGLAFRTVLIDITVPRSKEYLAINPSGMVPALAYNGEILTESGLICQYLVDSHPSHLLKGSSEDNGARHRYDVAHLAEQYFANVHKHFDAIVFATDVDSKPGLADKYTQAVARYCEPFLADAGPFFQGSAKPTMAEVMIGPFLLRVLNLPKHEQLVPASLVSMLQKETPKFWTWAETVTQLPSVNAIWDEELVVRRTMERIAKSKSS